MKTRFPFTAAAMMMLLMSSLDAAPAGIRPGPPPGPLGLRPAAVAADERTDEARKPGPPPDPLKEERQA